jgi:hypothetical protein
MFDPVPVFFSFHIINENGTILNIPQAGKLELSPIPLGYKVLNPNQYWSIEINLRGWIQDFLFPGLYHVTVHYHNQYGEDCYHGTLLSNEIKIKII